MKGRDNLLVEALDRAEVPWAFGLQMRKCHFTCLGYWNWQICHTTRFAIEDQRTVFGSQRGI